MRPVEPQSVAHRAAQHLVDRHPQGLGLDVDERVFDRRDRHLVDAARRLPGRRIEPRGDALDRARVVADQRALGELVDDRAQPLRAIALHVFRPADKALVGGDLQKRVDPPAGVAMQVFDLDDLHRRLPPLEPRQATPICRTAERPAPLPGSGWRAGAPHSVGVEAASPFPVLIRKGQAAPAVSPRPRSGRSAAGRGCRRGSAAGRGQCRPLRARRRVGGYAGPSATRCARTSRGARSRRNRSGPGR